MTTKATIEIEGEFIDVQLLLTKLNEFMVRAKEKEREISSWSIHIEATQ